MVDIHLALMTGVDIPIAELGLLIHQLTLKEISYIGENRFLTCLQLLCLDKEDLVEGGNTLTNLTNFQVLMKLLQKPELKEQKENIITFLSFVFVENSKIFITPSSIVIVKEDNTTITIDDSNFEIVQEYLKVIFCVQNMFQGDSVIYNPKGDKAKAIADKIMKGRKKVAELNGGKKDSLFGRYLSILSIGLQISILELSNFTLYQIFDLMERFKLYTEWGIDLKVRLAGGDPQNEVENWMKNIH